MPAWPGSANHAMRSLAAIPWHTGSSHSQGEERVPAPLRHSERERERGMRRVVAQLSPRRLQIPPLPPPKPRPCSGESRAALLTRLALPLLSALSLRRHQGGASHSRHSPNGRGSPGRRALGMRPERADREFRPCPPAPDAPPPEKDERMLRQRLSESAPGPRKESVLHSPVRPQAG